jgi:hypothetical protein
LLVAGVGKTCFALPWGPDSITMRPFLRIIQNKLPNKSRKTAVSARRLAVLSEEPGRGGGRRFALVGFVTGAVSIRMR